VLVVFVYFVSNEGSCQETTSCGKETSFSDAFVSFCLRITWYSYSIWLLKRWRLLKGWRGSVIGWRRVRLLDGRYGEFPLSCLSCEVYVEPKAKIRTSKIE
jgi:hypothetical protein